MVCVVWYSAALHVGTFFMYPLIAGLRYRGKSKNAQEEEEAAGFHFRGFGSRHRVQYWARDVCGERGGFETVFTRVVYG